MAERIHIVVDRLEKERFRADADAAVDRLDAPDQLDRCFAACDAIEPGREPDWEEHLKVIRGSIRKGASDT